MESRRVYFRGSTGSRAGPSWGIQYLDDFCCMVIFAGRFPGFHITYPCEIHRKQLLLFCGDEIEGDEGESDYMTIYRKWDNSPFPLGGSSQWM